MTRRSYTREFKAEAVRLVNDQGLSCAEAARDLGLHPSVLYRWVKGYGGDSHQAFPGHGQQGEPPRESRRPVSVSHAALHGRVTDNQL